MGKMKTYMLDKGLRLKHTVGERFAVYVMDYKTRRLVELLAYNKAYGECLEYLEFMPPLPEANVYVIKKVGEVEN